MLEAWADGPLVALSGCRDHKLLEALLLAFWTGPDFACRFPDHPTAAPEEPLHSCSQMTD